MNTVTSEINNIDYNIYDKIFPQDFRRASVLVIKNKVDTFLPEISRRNAGELFNIHSLRKLDNKQRYDYIYLHSTGFGFKQELGVIKNLSNICNIKLNIIFTKSPKLKTSNFVKNLFNYVDNFLSPIVSYYQKLYYFMWLKKQFRHRFSIIKTINYITLFNFITFVVIFEMRIIKNLLIISGPSGVGKSYFLERLASDKKILKQFRTSNLSEYKILTLKELKTSEDLRLDNVLLHFNLTREVDHSYCTYENEPAHIIKQSINSTIYVFVCPYNVLIERVKKRASDKLFWSRKVKIANSLITQYSQSGRVKQLYKNWIDYCYKNRCKLFYIDVGSNDSISFISEKKAMEIIDS